MPGQHPAEVFGDRRADSPALETWLGGDQTDPAEPTLGVGHAASGADDRSVVLDHHDPVGLHRGEAVDADTKRRHGIGLLHDLVHRIEDRRLGHGVDTSWRHSG